MYWTLGVEFQFYLLIAFAFPFLNTPSKYQLYLMFAAFFGLSFIHIEGAKLVFLNLPVFCIGILAFLFGFKRNISAKEFVLMTIPFLVMIWRNIDIVATASVILGILVLFLWNFSLPLIRYFSKISFSLYLTHVFIGGKVVNLGLRFIQEDYQRYLLFITALGISILGAHLFQWAVERPSLNLAKRYRYQNNQLNKQTSENSNNLRSLHPGSTHQLRGYRADHPFFVRRPS